MESKFLHVPNRFIRGAIVDEAASIESARWLITHMCHHVGLADLGRVEVLDVGCGVKFTQAILASPLPLKRYVGCDVDLDLITFLVDNVDDPRFEYFHLDAHNERYNPRGTVLTDRTIWPIEGHKFDLICLFSVFTHLNPHDSLTMLKLLRRYAGPGTRLFFTLYIDELTDRGHGLMDGLARVLANAEMDDWVSEGLADKTSGERDVRDFRDLDPTRPLLWAVYSEQHARRLIEESGWTALSLSPPDRYIQHHFVCAPA